ncbi:hypothetical protein FOIG_16772 [Fusarium odoratissimum NRRL 54006]|uniref:Uncharacterized protein n=1 Tax=Fusarium odoratissimum (strain NRRL 54006) TaxID=1089451 RepID=X0IM32_FUSO5|nr:uncharacterized protein FOIG_16772 [Fusarium odoratissimum NRRL 54006]EXL89948.1 hypothetical protein FOIG_16772 [Fusarium odoratissimum NRRL 54006]
MLWLLNFHRQKTGLKSISTKRCFVSLPWPLAVSSSVLNYVATNSILTRWSITILMS